MRARAFMYAMFRVAVGGIVAGVEEQHATARQDEKLG